MTVNKLEEKLRVGVFSTDVDYFDFIYCCCNMNSVFHCKCNKTCSSRAPTVSFKFVCKRWVSTQQRDVMVTRHWLGSMQNSTNQMRGVRKEQIHSALVITR